MKLPLDDDAVRDHIELLSGVKSVPLGSPDICLRVTRSDGTLLLELDQSGHIHYRRHSLEVENRVPERIVAAAAGGLDFTDLPDELRTVFMGDVVLADMGSSLRRGPWMTIEPVDELDAITAGLVTPSPEALKKQLIEEQSVLRCILFIADQVHREEEPEPHDDYTMQAQALMLSGWFAGAEVREKLTIDANDVDTCVSQRLPPKSSADAARRLAERLGYQNLQTTPPAAIYLWAVDNGVVDGLPDCYRVSVREEIET